MKKKVIIITGASSGIGKSIAESLIKQGHIVYGAARSINKMQSLLNIGGKIVHLDLTDDNNISEAVQKIIREQGRIDVLINNAGYGLYGAMETTPIQQARSEMEVNVFGLARMCQLFIPVMRMQKSGRIINISSIAGKLTSPLGCWYFASKHAVEGLSDSLRQELKPFGIDVVIIEPGAIRSDWAQTAREHLRKTTQNTPYEKMAQKIGHFFPFVDKDNSDPEIIVDLTNKAIHAKKPKTRYIGGKWARPLLFARKFLPDRVFDAAINFQLNQIKRKLYH
jgi:Short-chain dehydrogenases of various substrate specificities